MRGGDRESEGLVRVQTDLLVVQNTVINTAISAIEMYGWLFKVPGNIRSGKFQPALAHAQSLCLVNVSAWLNWRPKQSY